MSGCYGNSPEDRYWEKRLLDYLDQPCGLCGEEDCECCADCEKQACVCNEPEPPCPDCEEASERCECDD